jgi:hypothetical protein
VFKPFIKERMPFKYLQGPKGSSTVVQDQSEYSFKKHNGVSKSINTLELDCSNLSDLDGNKFFKIILITRTFSVPEPIRPDHICMEDI